MLKRPEEPMRRRNGLVIATAMTLAGLAVLLGLGTWQLMRRAEKLEIIHQITTRTTAAPVSLERAVTAWRKGAEVEYLKVTLSGRFLDALERHYFTTDNGRVGWHVYTPFATGFQHVVFAPKLVLVNRGFVPDELRDPAKRKDGLMQVPVAITGYIRKPPAAKATFDPDNDVAGNRWYWRDLQGMIASLPKNQLPKHAPFLPFIIDVDATPAPGGWPKGGATVLSLPNRHLEYALTWYGLALTLLGVYGVFAWGRVRTKR